MNRLAAVAVVLAVAACGAPGTSRETFASSARTSLMPALSATATQPQQPVTATTYAVLVSGLEANAPRYIVSIVDLNGRAVASATAANPDNVPVPWQPLPIVSTSTSMVYYLDGASSIRFLKPDGTNGVVMELPTKTGERAVFAVSTDDSRIAASVFNLTSGMRLYTANVGQFQTWHQIFATNAFSEWPVGWRGHDLVLGLGYVAGGQQTCVECAWRPIGVHVANPDTGARIQSICDSLTNSQVPAAAPTAAGVLCTYKTGQSAGGAWTSTDLAIAHWDGSKGSVIPTAPELTSCPLRGALSPDGAQIASVRDMTDCSNGTTIDLFDTSGRGRSTPAVGGYRQILWIDIDHVCYSTADDQSSLLAVSGEHVTAITAPGLCIAALPGGLGV